jgi:geranylgeranyl diphosphate synthase type I
MSALEHVERITEQTRWVEQEMEAVLADRPTALDLYQMLRYHLGWLDEHARPSSPADRVRFGGKKLRGPLCLLACEATGGDPRRVVPGAAAIELIHNFSLIHDDVEDQDAERRHRPTVWARWGIAHAVNAGSNMQALANQAGLRLLHSGVPAARVMDALECLTRAMLAMTEGQFLDIRSQDVRDTSIDEYLAMAAGKTAALIEAAARLGALVATERPELIAVLTRFGHAFGMAFQARDDLLGIWGAPESTGKPVGGDILKGKRSLPVVFGLSRPGSEGLHRALAARDVAAVTSHLEAAGARRFVEAMAARYTHEALAELDAPGLEPAPVQSLRFIAREALGRTT